MAEENTGQEKTETPTEHRREEIKKDGRVAYSREITGAIILGFIIFGFYFGGNRIFELLINMISKALTSFDIGDLNINSTMEILAFTASDLSRFLLFIMIILVVVGFIVGIIQIGFNISIKPIQPKLSKINPFKGITKIFSLSNFVDSIKITIKLLIIFALIYFISINDIGKIAQFSSLEFKEYMIEMWAIVNSMLIKLFITFLLIAGFDFIWQKFNFERQIKMTKQEYKEDIKQSEGDPLIKARIRQIQQKMSRARMLQEVPTSDVVITNPTHYAIVLKYDVETMDSPQLVAKGIDHLALRIIEIAKKSGVVITRKPEVARSLYSQLGIGDTIPAEFYQIIAEILAAAYRAKGIDFKPNES